MSAITLDQFDRLVLTTAAQSAAARPGVQARFFALCAAAPRLVRNTFRLRRDSRVLIPASRELVTQRLAQGESPAALVPEYRQIAAVRDNLLRLRDEISPALPACFPFSMLRRTLNQVLDDWDELAEDWAFACESEEIMRLAQDVANAL